MRAQKTPRVKSCFDAFAVDSLEVVVIVQDVIRSLLVSL